MQLSDAELSTEKAYRMGLKSISEGPNEENCHFSIFSSPEDTKAWERGRKEGKKLKSRSQSEDSG